MCCFHVVSIANELDDQQFEVVEQIQAFHRMQFTWFGPEVVLRTVLYIVRKNFDWSHSSVLCNFKMYII